MIINKLSLGKNKRSGENLFLNKFFFHIIVLESNLIIKIKLIKQMITRSLFTFKINTRIINHSKLDIY